MVKVRAKRHRNSFGPFRINRTGLRVTSVTMPVLMMTLDEIKAEMVREPNANLALEWIAASADTAQDAHDAAMAYLEAWDEVH